jgi:signal transduction histidine kinase
MSAHTDLDALLRTERELATVLEGLADTAGRLCGAARARFDLARRDGEIVRTAGATDGGSACLAVPVRSATGQVLGALVLSDARADAFTDRDEALVAALAEQAAQAVEQARRLEDLRRSCRVEAQRARLAEDVLVLMAGELPLARKLERAVQALVEHADAAYARVWTVDAKTGALVGEAAAGEHEPPTLDEEQLRSLAHARGAAAAPQLVDDESGAFAGFPLCAGDATLGVLALFTDRPLAPATLALVGTLATQLGAAIQRERKDTESARTRNQFIGMLAHDLRNPLSALTTGTQALGLMGNLDGFSRRTVDRMHRSALRMSRMVTQLTDFVRSQAQGLPLVRTEGDLHPLVREIVAEQSDAHPGRTLTLETLGSGEGSWDADRLAALFSTLVGNALDHSAAGATGSSDVADSAAAPVHVVLADGPDHSLVATVQGGPAIAAELLPGLFDPWQRATHSRTQATLALGLGLHLGREIARAHGGDLQVTSDAASGTTFRVVLPRQ